MLLLKESPQMSPSLIWLLSNSTRRKWETERGVGGGEGGGGGGWGAGKGGGGGGRRVSTQSCSPNAFRASPAHSFVCSEVPASAVMLLSTASAPAAINFVFDGLWPFAKYSIAHDPRWQTLSSASSRALCATCACISCTTPADKRGAKHEITMGDAGSMWNKQER